jgi:hypothetical protein
MNPIAPTMRWKTARIAILSIAFGMGLFIVLVQAWSNLDYILLLVGFNMVPIAFFLACAYGLSNTRDTTARIILLIGGILSGVVVLLILNRIMDFNYQMALGAALMNASVLFTRELG